MTYPMPDPGPVLPDPRRRSAWPVTAAIRELAIAGWVTLPNDSGRAILNPPSYRVTFERIGAATYGAPRRRYCQCCGKPAELFDLDGSWCTQAHRAADRVTA